MPRPPRQWTPEEDDLVRTHGGGGEVARLLRAKSGAAAAPSARQVKDRWMSLQPDRAWSRKENALILRCLCTNDSPTISWERLALSLPHRSAAAVRAHWQATEALLRPQLVAAWDVPDEMIAILGKVRPRAGGAAPRGVVRRLDPQIFHVVARPAVELMWGCGGNGKTEAAVKRKRSKTAPPPSKRARGSSPAAVAPPRTATVTPHVAKRATARVLPTRQAKATASPTVQLPSPTGSVERKKVRVTRHDVICI